MPEDRQDFLSLGDGPVMGRGPLQGFFVEELKASEAEAFLLAHETRALICATDGSPSAEDDEVDMLRRLQQPSSLGLLASRCMGVENLGRPTRRALVQRAFDVIPLPEDYEAYLLEDRIPGDLQALVRFLLEEGEFTPLHFLHALYALFLLPQEAARPEGDAAENLTAILALPDYQDAEKALFCLLIILGLGDHSAAASCTNALLTAPQLREDWRRRLAQALAGREGPGRLLRLLATDQGLLPAKGGPLHVPSLEAKVGRGAGARARTWLHQSPG